jgi:MFS family permease
MVVCLATAGWACAFGLGTQLLSQSMNDMGWNNAMIGWNTGVYYLGIATAAIFVPLLMRRWGNLCPALGMCISGLTLMLFPCWTTPIAWFVLRFGNGMAGALSLVPVETYLGQGTPQQGRSQQIAFYTVALTLGGSAGIGAGLPLYQAGPVWPFCLAGLLACGAGLLLWHRFPTEIATPSCESTPTVRDVPGNLLGYGSGWVQGFLEGGLVAFLGLYLLTLGMSPNAAGLMMGCSLAGVIVVQVPIGWLADRLGRLPVLLGCYATVIAGLTVLPFCSAGPMLACWLFLLGACSGAFYPLGLALLSDRIPEANLSRAYAFFMAMECVGSVVGPIVMGQGRDWFGDSAMFPVALAAVGLVLLVWGTSCLLQRRFNGAAKPVILPFARLMQHPDLGNAEVKDDPGDVHERGYKRA